MITNCNCSERKKATDGCPLQGECLATNVVYLAEVVETKVDGQERVDQRVCYGDYQISSIVLSHNCKG